MIVETVTAVYEVDEAAGTIVRRPKAEGTADHDVAPLRRDETPIPMLWMGEVRVGEPLRFVLAIREGYQTLRTTTPVVEVR